MSNAFKDAAFSEIGNLQELSDDLEEILLCIAYDGKAEDMDYISAMRKHVQDKYGKLIDSIAEDLNHDPYWAKSRIGKYLGCIVTAYQGLDAIPFLNPDAEALEGMAKDLLYENLIIPEADAL